MTCTARQNVYIITNAKCKPFVVLLD